MSESSSDSNRHRIVVGTDGSASSTEALRWAAQIATQTGAEITVIICWQYPQNYGMSGGWPSDWDPAADAAQVLARSLTTCVHQGHPAQLLVDASIGADMLVVGSRGHGGFVGLLLGSVSAYCTEHSQCPVVVVPPARISSD